MSRRGVWVGRAFAVLGLAAVGVAFVHASLYALLAGIGGFVAGTGFALAPLVREWLNERGLARPSDFTHVVDLLRRAHAGRAAWVVGLPDGDIEVVDRAEVSRDVLRRGAGIVQLASIDGRAHVSREPEGTFVAVGDFPFGAGVLLVEGDATPATAEAVVEELRRLVAGMRLSQVPERGEYGDRVAKQFAAMAGGAQTLDGVAKAGVELAQQLAQRGAAIVLQGGGPGQSLRVVAVSTGADQRLMGLAVPDGTPAARAVSAAMPVVSYGEEDVFGVALADRRRQDRAGSAFPLTDGHFAIGTLVVTGAPLEPLGSRLAAARAVHEAEQRAVVDPLTGLRNRRELDRQLSRHLRFEQPPQVTLIYLDLDRFKVLNDTLGHAAGDAALRHVAGILLAAVRDQDLAARIGGEEFAIWMAHTPLLRGLEVAERIRLAIETTVWRWNGTPYALTASCGVAGFPESVGDVNNLRGAADAALYRAKQSGRNRVEIAAGGG